VDAVDEQLAGLASLGDDVRRGLYRFVVGQPRPVGRDDAAAAVGVSGAGYVMLRLPLEVRDLFREWLQADFPDRERHVFAMIRQTRGGKDYDSTFGKRMTGGGPYAWMIGKRFETTCARLGLNTQRTELTTEHFRPPRAPAEQLDLF